MSCSRARRAGCVLAVVPLLLAPGCGEDSSDSAADSPLAIYVSLPLRGTSGEAGRDAADGARLALSEAGAEAGGRPIEARFLDDTDGRGEDAGWTPQRAAANARTASQDSTAIAFIGDFESGATRASLPVTNEARILQVSPASGALDLVAPFTGSDEVPEAQPSGERTFGRVIPSDVDQAEAAAGWARDRGWSRARIVSDHSGFGRVLARAFEAEAVRLGIEVGAGAGARVYLAGGPASVPAVRAREVLRVLAQDPRALIGSDAFLPPYGIVERGLFTSAAIDPTQLPAADADFADRFEAETGRAPGRYAAYGYEAMAVVLDSIERAADPGDREAVIDAFFATEDRASVLGTYSIDELGETTLDRMSGYEVRAGRPRPAAELRVP